nr:RNA-directed DNA polymerase, eukaryota [Tanacetum cinerariifolium]
MKEKLKKYFERMTLIITCAAALNPCFNVQGVEFLIESINFVTHLQTTEFETFDDLGFCKAKETTFLVLSRIAKDILIIQATSVASESAFSTSGKVLSIRRIRLTLASLEMCMFLKDHLDVQEHKQDKSTLETPVVFEEEILDAEVQANEAIPLSDEEIPLDATSSEGSMSGPDSRGEEAEAEYPLNCLPVLSTRCTSIPALFTHIRVKIGRVDLLFMSIVFCGKVYWMHAKEVPGWSLKFKEGEEEDDVSVEDNHGEIHSDQEINNCNEESDVEEVPETCFNVPEGQKGNPLEDPFRIYPLLNKDKNIREHNINEEESSFKHPPGFTPVGNLNEGHLDGGCAKKVNEEVAGGDNSFVHTVGGKENSRSVNKMSDSMGSCCLKKSGMPRMRGSILSFMEEVVKFETPPGFTPVGNLNEGHLDGGCAKKVNEEVARDDNSFMHTAGGIKLMIVVVYAPQEASEKRMLRDYLTHESDQWDGETVMMGDFNEVIYKSERFGLNFKAHDADIFHSFIHNAGLNEVHLGGSAFTWCHKSATKMSKLDRFLVFENLFHSCSNINAISLDHYILDHCPILLREAIFDYGPIPFRFYNYWLEVDGFDKLVRDAWNDAPGNKKNAIRNFMYKLKYTKEKIRGWLSTYRLNSKSALAKFKEDLRMFDKAIDKGNSPVEMVHKRLETFNKIQQRDDLERMVTKEEVKKAVWDCGSDKSPSPDGFTFSFFRHFWSTIKKDIFEVVDCFFTNEDMPNGCNSNFIAL